MIKLKKSERLEMIKEIISNQEIETQHDLLEKLAERQVYLTQATISRDMNELGIVKIPISKGKVIYGVSQPTVFSEQPNKTYRLIAKSVLEVSADNPTWPNCLHIKIIPGSGQALKKYLLEHFSDRIFSLLTDDDSLLLLAQDSLATDYLRHLLTKHLSD